MNTRAHRSYKPYRFYRTYYFTCLRPDGRATAEMCRTILSVVMVSRNLNGYDRRLGICRSFSARFCQIRR